METPPLLIRRVAQGKLALAISWFLGVPAFVFGVATILWPIQHLPIGDCLRADCTNPEAPTLVAPFVAPAMIALIGLAVGSLLLYRLTYRRNDSPGGSSARSGWDCSAPRSPPMRWHARGSP